MNTNLKKLTTGAVMIALATVLSFVKLFEAPYGGSVTAGSMIPIVLFAVLFDVKWGTLVSVTYGVIQMILGFYAPPTPDFLSFTLVILLDYIIAFGGLVVAGPVARLLHKGKDLGVVSVGIGTAVAMVVRFLCHFLSGILIWAPYTPEGMEPWFYSLTYNGGYMLMELIISVVIICLLVPALNRIRPVLTGEK